MTRFHSPWQTANSCNFTCACAKSYFWTSPLSKQTNKQKATSNMLSWNTAVKSALSAPASDQFIKAWSLDVDNVRMHGALEWVGEIIACCSVRLIQTPPRVSRRSSSLPGLMLLPGLKLLVCFSPLRGSVSLYLRYLLLRSWLHLVLLVFINT